MSLSDEDVAAINAIIDVVMTPRDHGPDGQTSCGGGCCDGWGPPGTRPGDEMDCPCPGPASLVAKRRMRGTCTVCGHPGHRVFGCRTTIIRGEW